jgi:hypothetical protein
VYHNVSRPFASWKGKLIEVLPPTIRHSEECELGASRTNAEFARVRNKSTYIATAAVERNVALSTTLFLVDAAVQRFA